MSGRFILEPQLRGGLAGGEALLGGALVQPSLVDGLRLHVAVGRAAHLPPVAELGHEARVGLGQGACLLDESECGQHGLGDGLVAISALFVSRKRRGQRGALRTGEALGIAPQQKGDEHGDGARLARGAVHKDGAVPGLSPHVRI